MKQPNEPLKGLPTTSRIQRRAAKMAVATLETPPQIAFQHSVLCQTSLPYRDPGPEIRVWERKQGAVSLLVEAGHAQIQKRKPGCRSDSPAAPNPA